jgi:phage protein D
MFNYVSVEFPQTTLGPKYVYSLSLIQKRYNHEIAVIGFRDWGVEYDVITPGSPVHMTITGTDGRRDFYGYIHHVALDKSPGKNFTEVTAVGGSMPMKQPSQTVYVNKTADQIVKEIATKYNFACYAVPHPRVYAQVAQAGHTDWELMVRLAKQSGYSLRAENTELYFQPLLEDYTKYRAEAPKFVMRSVNHPDGSSLYRFKMLVGESIEYGDETKAATAVSGMDKYADEPVSITQVIRDKRTRLKTQNEFFDKFDTSVVATDSSIAKYEAEAAESRSRFPYRATVEVLGDPTLKPDMPVYLDGIGTPYSGYWVVLETEHKVVEEQLNNQMYTTILTVGTDSLGSATSWTDSQRITAPDSRPKRTIIPNQKQTKVRPRTTLNVKSKIVTPAKQGTFGNPKNRSKAVDVKSIEPSIWQSTTSSLNNIITEPKKPSAVVNRLAGKYK